MLRTAGPEQLDLDTAADPANWWPPAPRALACSRGMGWVPAGLGWMMLICAPFMFADAFGLVDVKAPGDDFPDWGMALLGGLEIVVGTWFALGRAGAVVDSSGRYLHQWWGLIGWPWHTRTIRLDRCTAVRALVRVGEEGALVWYAAVIDAGEREFDLHRCAGQADAVRLAQTVSERTGLPFELRAEPPKPKGRYWPRR